MQYLSQPFFHRGLNVYIASPSQTYRQAIVLESTLTKNIGMKTFANCLNLSCSQLENFYFTLIQTKCVTNIICMSEGLTVLGAYVPFPHMKDHCF